MQISDFPIKKHSLLVGNKRGLHNVPHLNMQLHLTSVKPATVNTIDGHGEIL